MKKHDSLEDLLPFITRASRYLGNEINAVKKDLSKVDVKFALAFPDAYEVGMSHLGLHILYHVLNDRKHIACERAFAPWPDMESEMKKQGLTLATLESRIPLKKCDIVGFSLEYELSYATILRMLDLANIPLLAKNRDASFPLIIAGGPSTYNPEPVAAFFDAFVIGEGEEVILEVCDAFLAWKKSKAPKNDLLSALSDIPGIYVPSFFDVTYHRDGTVKEIIPLKKGYALVQKRVIADFNNVPYCTSPIVPYMQIIHDRAGIEIARGCSRGCRFCMAGMIYRPVREKSIPTIMALAEQSLAHTGYEELALASLSSGDYTGIQDLMKLLMDTYCHKKVAVSFPSLRVETLTRDLMEAIKQVRKTGFTLAPEAGTQRLRDVINKGITEEEILTTTAQIFSAGWNLIKLYFMIGLPTETREDLEGIVSLCRRIASFDRRKELHVSISTFIPKPHTPFQREAQEPSEAIIEKQRFLRSSLNSKNIQVKCHNHQVSLLEGVFSRGDRRLADVLVQANRLGAGFEAWTEYFNPELWDRAFQECAADKNFYLRKRQAHECLPWSHISCGISADFLNKELAKAFAEETTPDCRYGVCSGCGICSGSAIPLERKPCTKAEAGAPACPASPEQEALTFRYRLFYTKTSTARFLSHLELGRVFARAMRRAALPLKYSMGFHPLPRIIFYDALPVGMESLGEFCDIELLRKLSGAEIFESVNKHLPEGIKIVSAEDIVSKGNPLADKIKKYWVFIPQSTALHFPDLEKIQACIKEFHASGQYAMQSSKKGEFFSTDLKQLIQKITCAGTNTLEIELLPADKKIPKVTEIVGRIFNLGEQEIKALRIIKLIS